MVVLGECFGAHQDDGGFYAKEDERHFADPLFTPPSPPSYHQHPTPSSTAVDSPPNVLSSSTTASSQSTPTYTGMHLPLDADEVKTSDASKHDGEVKGLNSDADEDEDADAEGEDDDGEWIPATQGGQLLSLTLQDYTLQHALPSSSPSTTAESAFIATLSETSSTQPVVDDASNNYHHYPSAEYTAYADCAGLSVNATSAENDDPKRAIQPAVAGHGVADVADASLNALNTAYVLNADTHGEGQNAGSVAPFDNFDIYLSDLPANPGVWTTIQPERHIDVSPAFSTSLRSPYSFTEEELPFGAYDASSTLPFLGAQRGNGQTVFGSQYEFPQQLWDDMHAHQVFLSSGMPTTHAGIERATSAGIFLPTDPVHHRRAPWGVSSYIAPPSVHTRSAAAAGNAIQCSRNAQTDPISIPWVSSSQFPTPTHFAKGKGKAIASHNEQGPSDHPRPVAKLPSRSRNRTQASSRLTQAAAANVPPLDFHRQWVHYELGQIQASAGPSRLPTHSSNTHASMAIASTSRSATTASTLYDPSSFASTSQFTGSFAQSTTPALPTQQTYMSEFRVGLGASSAPVVAHAGHEVTDCAWVGLNGQVCGFRYQQNVMKQNSMWDTVHGHLGIHKNESFSGDYNAKANLSLGAGRKLKKPESVDERATNSQPQNKNGSETVPEQAKTTRKKPAKAYGDIKDEFIHCRMRNPQTGEICGVRKKHRDMSIHVCQEHYKMTVESDRKRRYNRKVAEDRAAKRARH